MKLYFSPGACSLASHIILAETGLPYQTEQVNLKDKTSTSGNYLTINPKGAVPCLKMENGENLTEGSAILQYIADQKPELNLIPKAGTTDRYRVQEWLNFIATDIHMGFSPLFGADKIFPAGSETNTQFRNYITERLTKKIDFVSEKLGKNEYIYGKNFSVADAYLFTCLNWSKYVNLDLGKWPNLTSYQDRIYKRANVQKALKEEGLLK